MPCYADPERNRAYLKKYHETYVPRDPRLPPRDIPLSKLPGYTYKGIPIVLGKTRGRPFKMNEVQKVNQTIFPKEEFVHAATIYAATGNPEEVSKIIGVPLQTVKEWIKQPAFKDILEEIRDENNDAIDAKFTGIVDKALDKVAERIENGDEIYDARRGEFIKKQISAKDLASITTSSIDKRQLLRGKPTSRTETVSEGKRLEQLAAQFIKMAEGVKSPKTIQGKAKEVIEDAVVIADT